MKRILYSALLLFAVCCLPVYARTPKEYFESGGSFTEMIDEDFGYLDAMYDYQTFINAVDSCIRDIHTYLNEDLLSQVEPNSKRAFELRCQFLSTCSYYLSYEEMRAVADELMDIARHNGNEIEMYTEALETELASWAEVTVAVFPLKPYSADTVAIVDALLEELRLCYHQRYRPADKKIKDWVRKKLIILYRNKLLKEVTSEDPEDLKMMELRFEYHEKALLWRELATWEDISAEEYDAFNDKSSNPFYLFDEYANVEDSTTCLSALSYFRELSMTDFVDAIKAHYEITKRIYGDQSERYIDVALGYVETLRDAATYYCDKQDGVPDSMNYIGTAKTVCEEVLKSKVVPAKSKDYYEWTYHLLNCRLTLEGPSKALRKQLDTAAKEMVHSTDTILYNDFLRLQVNEALMANDYKHAQEVLKERWNTLPMLTYDGENDSDLHLILHLIQPCATYYVRTYMLEGNFEMAREFFDIVYGNITSDYSTTKLTEPIVYARDVRDLCVYRLDYQYPYYWQLRKRFDEQLFKWSGYVEDQW